MTEQLTSGQPGETEVNLVLPTRYLEVCLGYLSIRADIEALKERIKSHGIVKTKICALGDGSSVITVVFANPEFATVCRDLVKGIGEKLGISLLDSQSK